MSFGSERFLTSIPRRWEDVTPDWMTRAVHGNYPGAVVDQVDLLMSDDGTNRRARFALHYEQGSGPDVVFVKAEGKFREVHARNGNLFNEPELFACGAAIPVDHPFPYSVLIDRPGLDYVIVMEDVTRRGADPRDATRPLSVAQVANGLGGLAILHSHYWRFSGVTHPQLAWVATWAADEGFAVGLRARVPQGLERAGPCLPAVVRRLDSEWIVDAWSRSVDLLSKEPVTLLHGDPHVGNTYVLPDDDVGFLDWQVLRRGSWAHDAGYFLVSALTVEDRRRSEAELIEAYRTQLDVPDEQKPTADDAWLRYRATPAYGLAVWLATLGSEGAQTPEVCLALCERYGHAYAELGTEEAIEALT